MTPIQDILGKILKDRILAGKRNGTLAADKPSLSRTLAIFLAHDKITNEQYVALMDLLNENDKINTAYTI